MKYETRQVFIVKHKDDGHIERVFGEKTKALFFVSREPDFIIDEWPVEFLIKDDTK